MSKNRFKKAIAGLVIGAALVTTSASAIDVNVNGNPVSFDVAPTMINERTMVPMRAIFEALGADVIWNDGEQSITAVRGSDTIRLVIDVNVMTVNGSPKVLEIAPTMISDRTMIPIRAISEALGCKVEWEEATETVNIIDDSRGGAYVSSWKTAFSDFLNSQKGKFDLIYLNGDDIPEIAIMESGDISSKVKLYTYSGGTIKPIVQEDGSEGFGMNGTISYKEKGNMIEYKTSGGLNISLNIIANVNGTSATTEHTFEYNTKRNTAKLDDRLLDLASLDSKLAEMTKDFKKVDYTKCLTINKENVSGALGL